MMQVDTLHIVTGATLLTQAARWRPEVSLGKLSAEVLSEIAAEHDLDFATAVLYDRLRKSSQYIRMQTYIDRLDEFSADESALPSLIAIVPGAFYVESPQTGADGKEICAAAAMLGIPCEVVPLKSFGSLAENSRIISDWLVDRGDKTIVLVSLSKGGAEVKHAMSDAPAAFDNVTAWINLSGILEQSPLAQWLLRQPVRAALIRLWFWWRGYNFAIVHVYARRQVAPWKIPQHVRTVHVVGFPLKRHLSTRLARRGRERLAALGPNDSAGNILAEVVSRPGWVVPIWGADHYLRPDGRDSAQLVRQLLVLACGRDLAVDAKPIAAGAHS